MEGKALLSAILSPAPLASPLALLPAPLLLAGALLLPLLSYVTVLIFIAAFTLFERKTMGLFQRREGPDRVGLEGFGQPFADGLKLVLKETLLPRQTPAPSVFYLAPLLSLTLSLALWLLLPLGAAGALVSSPISLLLLLALSSLGSYGVIYSGWASNNKYALLGSLRAVAQFISYEIILSLLFLPFVAAVGSLNLWAVVSFQGAWGSFGYLAPLALIFAIAMLAETNRTPFDLPEAEAELVSGFNVEYSSLLFAFFFLAEYGSMGLMAALFVALFGGGWTSGSPLPGELAGALPGAGEALAQCATFALRALLLCLVFVFVRASLPRQRFDQLIALCWKYLFPLSLTLVLWSLALYSLASRWLRGDELLSLAAAGDPGGPKVPWWLILGVGFAAGYAVARGTGSPGESFSPGESSAGDYPSAGEEWVSTPDATRAMLEHLARGNGGADTLYAPLRVRGLGPNTEMVLEIRRNAAHWPSSLCYLAQGPRGGPYRPFTISGTLDAILPSAEMVWNISAVDVFFGVAGCCAINLLVRNQQELQLCLREATEVLRKLNS